MCHKVKSKVSSEARRKDLVIPSRIKGIGYQINIKAKIIKNLLCTAIVL